MGKHSIRGVLTGEVLNVVRTPPKWYKPRHGIRYGYVDRDIDGVQSAFNATVSAGMGVMMEDGQIVSLVKEGKVIPLRRATQYLDANGENRFRVT